MEDQRAKKYRFSTQRVIFVFLLIFIIFVAAPLFYLQMKRAKQVGKDEAYLELERESAHVLAYTQELLRRSESANRSAAREIKSGRLSLESPDELQYYFLNLLQGYDEISSLYFGNAAGGLADAGVADGAAYFIETENFLPGTFHKYLFDNPEEELAVVENFDARTRPWYQNALSQDGVVWSDAYLLFAGQDMALSSSLAVYDEDEHFLGVVGNDIFLTQLSDFLAEETASDDHLVFIMDERGLLVAASDGSPLFRAEEEEYTRLKGVESPSPLIAAAAQRFEEKLAAGDGESQLAFSVGEESYYLETQPLTFSEGREWTVVVAAPCADFEKDIQIHRKMIGFSYLILLFFSLVFSFFGNRWALSPLLRLTDQVTDVERFIRSEDEIPNTSRLIEISQLTASFNQLRNYLQTAFAELEAEVEEHKAAKEALAVSEARYRAVVENVPGFVTAFLPDGEITFVNQQYADYYQKTVEELLGVNFLTLLPHEEGRKVSRELHALTPEIPVGVLTQLVITPAGEKRRQRWVNRSFFNEQGEVTSYLSFGEDIEEEYRVHQYRLALLEIAQAANQFTRLDDFYHSLQQIVEKFIQTKNFYIALENPAKDRLELVHVKDQVDERVIPVTKGGLSEYVWRHGKTLLADTEKMLLLKEEEGVNLVGKIPAVWLGVPLQGDGKPLGVIAIQDYQEAWIGEAEKEFLEVVSTAIANTILRKRAEEKLKEIAKINAWLYLAGQEMSKTIELDSLYTKIYEIVTEAMPCDTLILSSFHREKEKIVCEFIIHEGKQENIANLPPIPLEPEGQGLQSRVIRSGKAMLINDLRTEIEKVDSVYYMNEDGKVYDKNEIPEDGEQSRSGLYIPLKRQSDVIGVLQVLSYKENAYLPKDLEFLQALSTQISFSVHNARLLKERQNELERRMEAEKELRELNQQLEARVTKRTFELKKRVRMVENLNEGMKNMMQDLNLANDIARQRAAELEHSNQELEAFTYSVSHDLRAPLRHIESFSRLLQQKENDLEPASRRYLENIIVATERMRRLIEDLLVLSRAGSKEMHIKIIQFKPIIESILAQQFDEVEGREIVWKIALLPPVRADAGLMKILWENLIGNALKYTRPRKTARIEIGFHASERGTTFFIQDNGTGFPPEYKDKIFIAFQRFHKSDEFEGSGVGLAIVKRIIERHDGIIWADSEEGKGSIFSFTLNTNK